MDHGVKPRMEMAPLEELRVEVAFDLPFCLYLPDDAYQVRLGARLAVVHLLRVVQASLDPRLFIERSDLEFANDRFGRLRYSNVKAVMPGEAVLEAESRRRVNAGLLDAPEGRVSLTVTSEGLVTEYGEAAFDLALSMVNRLIEEYRELGDQYHVRRLAPDDILRAQVNWFQGDQPLGGNLQLRYGSGLTLQPQLGPDRVAAIKVHLLGERARHPSVDLFLDAKDYLDRREYRLAVINARTALEVLVDQVLLTYFITQGVALPDVRQILHIRPALIATVEAAVQWAEINRKLGHGLKVALNLDIPDGNPKLWEAWLKAKSVREKGIHRGSDTSRSDAIEAVNTMGRIVDDIWSALGKAARANSGTGLGPAQ